MKGEIERKIKMRVLVEFSVVALLCTHGNDAVLANKCFRLILSHIHAHNSIQFFPPGNTSNDVIPGHRKPLSHVLIARACVSHIPRPHPHRHKMLHGCCRRREEVGKERREDGGGKVEGGEK